MQDTNTENKRPAKSAPEQYQYQVIHSERQEIADELNNCLNMISEQVSDLDTTADGILTVLRDIAGSLSLISTK